MISECLIYSGPFQSQFISMIEGLHALLAKKILHLILVR